MKEESYPPDGPELWCPQCGERLDGPDGKCVFCGYECPQCGGRGMVAG